MQMNVRLAFEGCQALVNAGVGRWGPRHQHPHIRV